MRKIAILGFAASALVVGGIAKVSANKVVKEERDAHVIVSFKDYSQSWSEQTVLNYQNYDLALLRNQVTSNFKVNHRYSTLLNAVLMEVPSSKVNDIRNLSFVDKVNYDTARNVTEQDGLVLYSKAAKATVGEENVSATTMNVPENTNKGEGVLIGILDSGFLLNHYDEATGQTYTHETFTALDEGVSTKLSKADVDAFTGLNATAPEGGSLYFNSKVPFAYDYGGEVTKYDDYGYVFNGDNDVFSDVSEHGLHVASMAAGNGKYKGIASNAQLALFKIGTDFHPEGAEKKKYSASNGLFDSNIIRALEDASKIGCDVLNMSFGSDLQDFKEDDIIFDLLQQLRDQGVWSNYAAGNSGKGYYRGTAYEGWTSDMVETGIVSSSAALESVMTVGASQAKSEFYEDVIQINGQNISYMDEVVSTSSTTYDPERPLWGITEEGTKDLEWVRLAKIGEASEYKNVNVQGKVAIVDRGTITFEEKYKNAKANGAIALAVVNTSNDAVRMAFGNTVPEFPVILINYEDRDKVGTGSGTMKVLKDVYADNPTATEMASFTSDGPTYDFRIKPEISTPGHNVKGAVCENSKGKIDPSLTDEYAYWSGTSMATPNYTGVVALMLGENLDKQNYQAEVNARTMSTATQYLDNKKVPASVRIQGAGVVNVKNALETEVYLEESAGSGKAKIQLQNNDDIKNGTLKLSFSATNTTNNSITYNAFIDIYAPDVYKYEKASAEIDAVKNIKIQGFRNKLLRTVKATVTIAPGTNTITLEDIELNAEEKKYLTDNFDYAAPVEGYVRLENAEHTNLSIPFLGYFGDVSEAIPVEPFNFEKDTKKTYPSTLVKDIATLMEMPNADFSSDIVTGWFKKSVWEEKDEDEEEESSSSDTSPLEGWFYNRNGISGITDSNSYLCSQIGNRKNSDGSYTLYSGNDASKRSNTLLIQAFVMRSIKTNTLNIYKKTDNSLVLADHMFDTFWGTDGDPDKGEDPNYSLGKSFVLDDYLSNFLGHRAYSIIPLWDNEKDSETYLQDYEPGEYTIEFKYTTMDNKIWTYTYDFVISNAEPKVASVSENGNYIRVRFDDVAGCSSVSITGQDKATIKSEQDSDGFYTDIPKTLLTKAGKLFYSTSSLSKMTCGSVLKMIDGDIFSVTSTEFNINNDFKVAKTAKGSATSYEFTWTRNNSKVTLTKPVRIVMPALPGYDASQMVITDYDKDNAGHVVDLEVTPYGVAFTSEKGVFDVSTSGDKAHNIAGIGANLTKDAYILGDTFDASVVSAYYVYDNGVTEPLPENATLTVTGFDSTTVGEKQLTVSYGDYTTTVGYTVSEPPAVDYIEAFLSKTNYNIGDTLDLTNLNVVAVLEDGSRKVLDVADVTVTGFDTTTSGTKELTVTYGEFSCKVEYKVLEPTPEPEPEPEPTPSKGCRGEVVTTSIILSTLALTGVCLLLLKKRKED